MEIQRKGTRPNLDRRSQAAETRNFKSAGSAGPAGSGSGSRFAASPRPSAGPRSTRANAVSIVGALAATSILVAAFVSGAIDATNTTLVVMGFDPDRAQLITSLIFGGVAAAAAELVSGRFRRATAIGFAAATLLYVGTFVSETQGALAATGVTGAFDPGGWLLTLATLIVFTVIAAWAGTTLAFTARPFAEQVAAALIDAASTRRVARTTVRYPLAALAIAALLVVTVPAFGDLVNFAPDSLMRGGVAPIAAATAGSADQAGVAADAAQSASPTADPSGIPSPAASHAPAQSPTPSTKPWLAWLPSGPGHIAVTSMAAPWKGGTASAIDVTFYTPPGYDPAGSRHYPVLYEAPTGYHLWGGATNVKAALDTLIDSGAIPAMIVVFIDSSGGPFPDTECADSFDHRQWFDTFVSQTMVRYVDTHYLATVQAADRAVIGMSEGGYCAANLALRHHDTFGTAISFSGYYQAGSFGFDSQAPFGGNKTLLAANSPEAVAAQLDAAARARLYFVVVAKADQPEFGPQATAFEKDLATDGYRYDALASSEPHGWPQVRDNFAPALEAWAARMASVGAV